MSMTYEQFLEYIYQRYSGNVKLGLDRMEGILSDMLSPQDKLKGIHVAGTNGKGSTCATLEALALAHHLHTGLNTSPHLIDYTERFRIDGRNIGFERVLALFHEFEDIFSKWDASFFEITTAIAFELLAREKVDTAIIEVGLGGRLDATNLFTPQVGVITTIGLDHVKTLGDSVEKIAAEKAGIIKEYLPMVIGRIPASPLQVITDKAAEMQAPVYLADRDFLINNVSNTVEGVCFDYDFADFHLKAIQTNLLGSHQAVNVATALTAFLLYCHAENITPDEHAIRHALANIHWMGRMQILRKQPLVIVDGAHNLQGIEVLVNNLKTLFGERKLFFVISILADKDYEHMLRLLCPLAKRFYISKNTSDRAAEIEEQTVVVQECGIPFTPAPTVKEAYALALADANPEDIIIGGGSLYTVAEIISATQA